MKKQVMVALVLCIALSGIASAYQIQSVPESFNEEVHVGDCVVKPLTMLVSDDTNVDFDFSVTKGLAPYVHVTRIDDSHFHVYLHPTEEVVGQELNGNIYVSAAPRFGVLGSPLGKVTFPVEITMGVLERDSLFERSCPVLGEAVEAVPLSLDAVSLLLLVLISLGVVNVSARLRLKKK